MSDFEKDTELSAPDEADLSGEADAASDRGNNTLEDDNSDSESAPGEEAGEGEIDYAKRVEDDLEQIRKEFPTLYGINDITDLKNPLRFGALRDLGLTAKEAFLASGGAKSGYDNRAHLTSSVPKRASSGTEMSRKEYELARDLFTDLSESEIKKLYKRVTK